jgi:hypothetical protein
VPDRSCWFFCRACGYRGLFVAKPEESVECPQCHDHGRDKAIMRRQDVGWMKAKEEAR